MKKRAFTMVELIFVIVILGILAAVAVPRLNASRADAKTAALKANLVTLAKDFESYYAANGAFCTPAGSASWCNGKLSDITSVPFDRIDGANGYFQVNDKNCVQAYAGCYDKICSQVWAFYINNNSDCLAELRKPQYADVQWLFTGYTTYDASGTPTAPKNVVKAPEYGGYARHWMNEGKIEW